MSTYRPIPRPAPRAMPSSARVRPCEGFTLVELLLSMALTAMLLGMLSVGVYAVVNDWQRETSTLDDAIDKALVVLQLDRALQAAFAHSYIDPERITRLIYFEGSDEALSFVSTVSPRRTTGLTAWRLQSGRAGVELSIAPAMTDNPEARLDLREPVLLLPNYSVRFSYLLQRDIDSKEWLDTWDGDEMQSLPRAVHVVLTPLDAALDDDVLEIIAPIRSWRHELIEPTLQVF